MNSDKSASSSNEDEPNDLPAKILEQVRKSTRKAAKTSGRNAVKGSPEYSGARADDRDPMLVKQGLSDLVSERGWQRQSAVGSVIGRWREIVGNDVADHVHPESFHESTATLYLVAESTAWATQIRLLIPTILTRLDQEIGQGLVAQIDVKGPNSTRKSRH